jgi:D-aspartate ligase
LVRVGEHESLDVSVPVLIFKVARGLMHQGQIGLIRSLGRLGVPVYSFHDAPWAPPALSRYARAGFTWPLSDAPASEIVGRLREAGERIGQRAVLIPIDDVGSLLVDEHAADLEQWFLFPHQPPGLARALANKRALQALCQHMGVATASTVCPASRSEVAEFARTATFPVVLKAADPTLLARRHGARSVVIARDAVELVEQYDRAEAAGPANLLLQEYIPGGADSIWMFNGYFNAHSDCLVGFTGQKLRQHPPHTGSTSLGICVRNETVEQITRGLMKQLGYRGVLDIGYRYDARDGRYKLLDANPRIGATFRLFVSKDDMDVARALYLDLTGQRVRASTAPNGRKWIVENHDLESGLQYVRARELGPAAWLRSLAGVREAAWFARDDPAPFAMMLAGAGIQSALRLASARWRSGPSDAKGGQPTRVVSQPA